MDQQKLRVAVLFGGRSVEHEVSLESAKSVLGAIDQSRYDVVPIGVTKTGEWVTMDGQKLAKQHQASPAFGALVSMLPDPSRRGLVSLSGATPHMPPHRVDVVFPLIHGPLGEDGAMQGLLELAGIPYVGAGVLGSSLAMDKAMSKTYNGTPSMFIH